MSDNSHKHPIKMRTFSADMDAVRKQNGEPTAAEAAEAEALKMKKPEPAPQAMPASFDRPDPEKIKRETPKPPAEIKLNKKEIPKPEPIKESPIVITEPTQKVANSTIPAFHELQKNVSQIQENVIPDNIATRKKKKKGEKIKNVPRPNIGYDATIITDTKSDRFQLFPSITAAIKGWFTKLTAAKKKAIPKYTIPEAERRKGVIQRATSKTGTIFTADSDTLREQIRQRRLQEELEDEEPETVWTPFTDAGYNLLEAPDEPIDNTPTNVVVEFKRAPQIIEPNNPTLVVPKPAPVAVTEEISDEPEGEEYEAQPEESIATETDDLLAEARWAAGSYEPTDNITPVYEEASESEMVSVPVFQAPEETEVYRPEPVPDPEPEAVITEYNSNTNTLTITILVAIVGAVAIFFAARVVFNHLATNTTSDAVVVVKSEPIIASAALVGLPVSVQTLNQIPTILINAISSSSEPLTEYVVVSGVGEEVSPSYLFEVLAFDTKANLRQSLTAAHFITLDKSKPAMVLSFVDEDAVRGGLLQWEPFMNSNFNQFYGNTELTNATFVDKKIADLDVRVLVDGDGIERVTYGFLSENTVLITHSTQAFLEIYNHQ